MPAPSSGKKIVVSDDDATLREILQELFLDRGHAVHGASDGEEALPLILREKPDLLILDLNMPLRDGLEVMKELKRHPDLDRMKILIVSGSQNKGDRLLCEALGAHGFIAKPFNCEELVLRVDALLQEGASLG